MFPAPAIGDNWRPLCLWKTEPSVATCQTTGDLDPALLYAPEKNKDFNILSIQRGTHAVLKSPNLPYE